jgi:hypothetical protein
MVGYQTKLMREPMPLINRFSMRYLTTIVFYKELKMTELNTELELTESERSSSLHV